MNSLTAFSQPLLRWGGDPSGGAPYVYADPANPQSYTGFEPTGDRARTIFFSKPYDLFRLQLTDKKTDNQITSLEECRKYNKSVGTLVNCVASRLLEEGVYKVTGYQDPELGRGGCRSDGCSRRDVVCPLEPEAQSSRQTIPDLGLSCRHQKTGYPKTSIDTPLNHGII
ncbi:MAG: hypothetical protein WCK85_07455 [Chlorobium sp.]